MRSISYRTYFVAFILSSFLFGVGILAGVYLAQSVNVDLQHELSGLSSQTSELEVLLLFNPETTPNSCELYRSSFEEFNKETTEFGVKIDALEQNRGIDDPTVRTLKREYNLKQVRDYLLVQKINTQCQSEIPTLLYFYSNNCSKCQQQGKIGPDLKKAHPELMIYALDASLNMPAIKILKQTHDVTEYPTLVLNNQTLKGIQSLNDIEAKLTS
jgi:hypothetical protein